MGWRMKNLTTATSGAPLAVYQPTAWLFAQFTRHVVFQGYDPHSGGDGQLYELYCSESDDWNVKNLVSEAGGAAARTNANGYIWAHQGSQHVVYQGSRLDGHVHELWYTEDDGWNANDLTHAATAPLALSQPFQEAERRSKVGIDPRCGKLLILSGQPMHGALQRKRREHANDILHR